MDGQDIAAARAKLGQDWGIGRELTRPEFARALGLSPTNGNDHILNLESGKSKVTGPIELLVRHYLNGVVPFDDQAIFTPRSRRRIDPETGEMPPEPKGRRKGRAAE